MSTVCSLNVSSQPALPVALALEQRRVARAQPVVVAGQLRELLLLLPSAPLGGRERRLGALPLRREADERLAVGLLLLEQPLQLGQLVGEQRLMGPQGKASDHLGDGLPTAPPPPPPPPPLARSHPGPQGSRSRGRGGASGAWLSSSRASRDRISAAAA